MTENADPACCAPALDCPDCQAAPPATNNAPTQVEAAAVMLAKVLENCRIPEIRGPAQRLLLKMETLPEEQRWVYAQDLANVVGLAVFQQMQLVHETARRHALDDRRRHLDEMLERLITQHLAPAVERLLGVDGVTATPAPKPTEEEGDAGQRGVGEERTSTLTIVPDPSARREDARLQAPDEPRPIVTWDGIRPGMLARVVGGNLRAVQRGDVVLRWFEPHGEAQGAWLRYQGQPTHQGTPLWRWGGEANPGWGTDLQLEVLAEGLDQRECNDPTRLLRELAR